MERTEILRRAKAALQGAFGGRLQRVILYGSEARGTAGPDSDVDLLVLLDGPVSWDDSRKSIHVLSPLIIEFGRAVHAFEVSQREYEKQGWPLYRVVKEEGIPL
jgi:predicted nucleotidyltransferase